MLVPEVVLASIIINNIRSNPSVLGCLASEGRWGGGGGETFPPFTSHSGLGAASDGQPLKQAMPHVPWEGWTGPIRIACSSKMVGSDGLGPVALSLTWSPRGPTPLGLEMAGSAEEGGVPPSPLPPLLAE